VHRGRESEKIEILEQLGFTVVLVNARDAKHVPGRKTDVTDAQSNACRIVSADSSGRPLTSAAEYKDCPFLHHRRMLCGNSFSEVQESPDADRVYAEAV
jgi:hypothetical protein